MKPYDNELLLQSATEVLQAKLKTDLMIGVIFSMFYLRFFHGRSHVVRGDA